MAAGKKILRKSIARGKLLEGINDVAEVVASTYGPRGRTVAFDKGTQVRMTKDGITVAKEIKFTDEIKNLGAMMIKETAGKSNFMSGDGSTGTTILCAGLCSQAHKLLNQGIDINDLRKGYESAKDLVLKELEPFKLDIKDDDDIFNIAKISANNDEEIAKYITEAFTTIGDNGIVSIADSMSKKGITSVNISSGLEFDRGFLSSLSVNAANDQCILNEPKILLSSEIVNEVEPLILIAQPLQLSKSPLIIIAPDFTDEVLSWFREMLSKKTIIGSLVLAPGVSKNDINDKLIDLSLLLNAKILGQDFSINEYNDSYLGSAEQVIITKGKTTILNAHSDEKEFNRHIELLKAKVDCNSTEIGYSEFEIETVKERIAKMTGGVATIYIGALTNTELGEKKDRYEDAVNAVRSALKNGYLPGAGTILMRISYTCKWPEELTPPQLLAFKAFMKSLRMPCKLLIQSAGADPEIIINELLLEKDNGHGFNAKTGKISNLFDDGILDSYDIINNSVIYASNMALSFMSIDSIIASDIPGLTIDSLDEVLNDSEVKFV